MNPPLNSPARMLLTAALLACVVLGSGCVSAKYKPADTDTPPPVLLNVKTSEPPIDATIHSVIVFQGPGSWKREAYWDEYVVSFVNHAATPLVIDAAVLVDFRGEATLPGDDPWQLEKQSLSLRDALNRAAKTTLVNIGGGLAVASLGGAIAAASLVTTTSAAAGTWAVGILGAAVLPVYIGGAIYRNVSSRHDIEAEFARRRLVLPVTLAPGQTVQGSLFFRISPSPQRLELRGRSGESPAAAALALDVLSGLHLNGTHTPAGSVSTFDYNSAP